MKIFSLFGKKQQAQADAPAANTRACDGSMRMNGAVGRSGSTQFDQRNAARATELKIDAIESAMTLDLDANLSIRHKPGAANVAGQASAFNNTVQLMDASTEILFDDSRSGAAGALAAALPPPAVEEAAILFANGQQVLAEQLLQNAILEEAPVADAKHAYLLLFDLYQLSGQQQAFDRLSTDYIGRFETSPPAWRDSAQQAPSAVPASGQPSVVFPPVLDHSSARQIEQAQQLSASSRVLQLDFGRIREIDPAGCTLLLQLLRNLHQSDHDLILPGAPHLIERIKSTLQTGRRKASAAPWLLLLELLRRLDREQEFEESSIDYCITFEISPPAFEAPLVRVAPSVGQTAAVSQPERFLMPPLVAGDTRQLLEAIAAFAADRETVMLDCAQLKRIDFTASGQLLTGLVPLAGNDRIIEFHEVNYLVAALLNVMGLKEIARIIPHKG
ncbi:STAS domain-containing protein [Herminiimonas sp. CN]|uniref:STAS domain-containing protein n=1 Tax=Herminiimonas sp. CN TaxID=1349818 RepID=UPI0004743EA5|nr:STAS domain-containing protein [Herminiimonas sp. CN]